MEDQIKELTHTMMQVRVDLAKLDTKMDSIKDLATKLEVTEKTTNTALTKAEQALYRLDKIDKILFWVGTTFFGALLIAAATFVVRGGLFVK